MYVWTDPNCNFTVVSWELVVRVYFGTLLPGRKLIHRKWLWVGFVDAGRGECGHFRQVLYKRLMSVSLLLSIVTNEPFYISAPTFHLFYIHSNQAKVPQNHDATDINTFYNKEHPNLPLPILLIDSNCNVLVLFSRSTETNSCPVYLSPGLLSSANPIWLVPKQSQVPWTE